MNRKVTLEVTGIPEAMAAMRRELALMLRAEADQSVVRTTSDALRRVANCFEAGIKSASDVTNRDE